MLFEKPYVLLVVECFIQTLLGFVKNVIFVKENILVLLAYWAFLKELYAIQIFNIFKLMINKKQRRLVTVEKTVHVFKKFLS